MPGLSAVTKRLCSQRRSRCATSCDLQSLPWMTSKSSIPEIVHRETIMQPSRRNVLKRAVLIACVGLPLLASPMISAAEAAEPLRLAGRTELPRYSGDFDHFAVDVAGARLFLAGED